MRIILRLKFDFFKSITIILLELKKSFRGTVIMPECVEPSWSGSGAFGTPPDVKDPVQGGVLKNCSLIAAFASLAWKQKISAQAGPIYSFKFYRKDQNNNTVEDVQKADGILPLNTFGNLMHAKSDTPSKFWPALYEKAYYMWLDNVGLQNLSVRPNYCKYTGTQNPSTVLFQLTGKEPAQKSWTNADAVFGEIDLWCDNCGRSPTNRIIKTPAVAWTRDTGTEYSDTTIVVQHTYSLLGVTGEKVNNLWTKKYVVLRNPFGTVRKDPASGSVSVYTAGGLWCSTNIYLNDPNDGIFAISAADFFKYFAGYAWTPI